MHTIQNLTIIGTSHIAVESIEEVAKAVQELKPDVIALELDLKRFKRLISNTKHKIKLSDITQKGFLINLIGSYLERYLGKKVGVLPGAEMRKAIELARKNKIKSSYNRGAYCVYCSCNCLCFCSNFSLPFDGGQTRLHHN